MNPSGRHWQKETLDSVQTDIIRSHQTDTCRKKHWAPVQGDTDRTPQTDLAEKERFGLSPDKTSIGPSRQTLAEKKHWAPVKADTD